MKHSVKILFLLACITTLSACSTLRSPSTPTDSAQNNKVLEEGVGYLPPTPSPQVETIPTPLTRELLPITPPTGEAQNTDLGSLCHEQLTILFNFDEAIVQAADRDRLLNYSRCTSVRGQHWVIEGHTDEQGSREYNLALGQMRAETVRKILTLAGLESKHLEAVSFGEEKPADTSENDEARIKNRRAVIRARTTE